MANISRCRKCGNQVPKQNPIITDEANIPMRFCSTECMNNHYESEAAQSVLDQEFDARCSVAIAKGLAANPGLTFEDAGDGLINSWFEEYGVFDVPNKAADKSK